MDKETGSENYMTCPRSYSGNINEDFFCCKYQTNKQTKQQQQQIDLDNKGIH